MPGMIQRATVPENSCVPSTYSTFQDPQCLPYLHKKYWTMGPLSRTRPAPWIEPLSNGRSDMPRMIPRATVPGKVLRPNHIRYIPTLTVKLCPILTRNIGSIVLLSSTRPSPWNEPLPNYMFDISWNRHTTNIWPIDQELIWCAPTQSHLYALV